MISTRNFHVTHDPLITTRFLLPNSLKAVVPIWDDSTSVAFEEWVDIRMELRPSEDFRMRMLKAA